MSTLRKQNRDVNLRLNRMLNEAHILLEARSTSKSGLWLTCIGYQQYKGMPSWCVLNIRVTDWHVEFRRWSVVDSDEGFDDAKKEAYAAARLFYEDAVVKLQTYAPTAEDEAVPTMEVVNPDGSIEKLTIN